MNILTQIQSETSSKQARESQVHSSIVGTGTCFCLFLTVQQHLIHTHTHTHSIGCVWVIWFGTSLLVKWRASESTQASTVTSFLLASCSGSNSNLFEVHSSSWLEFALLHLLITRISDSKQARQNGQMPWASATSDTRVRRWRRKRRKRKKASHPGQIGWKASTSPRK